MLLAIAILFVQHSIPAQIAFSAEKLAIIQPATEISAGSSSTAAADSLPDAPVAIVALNSQPADPEPFIISHPIKKETISVDELRAENRRKERTWFELGLVEHSAATFDAYTTRRAIVDDGGHELNPLLKPFAGNASMYVAIQVGPVIMDYVAKKMMYNRHNWVRRLWWVPQSASTVTSLFCGVHNLGVQPPVN